MTQKDRKDVYERTTDRIVAMLEEGVVPWRKPWTGAGLMPCNANSKRPYRGWNLVATLFSGYSSPYWATLKGWNKLGGKVKKGEKGTLVVGWKSTEYTKTTEDEETGEVKSKKARGLVGFAYTVFNEEQIEGEYRIPGDKRSPEREHAPIEDAQAIVDNSGAVIRYGGNRACYAPLTDEISLPHAGQFESDESFYSTAFHELTHWTGAEDRLDRFEPTEGQFTFESESYSKEELVAEFGAAFLAALTGIEHVTEEASAAYIGHWIEKLRSDKKLLISAASKAQAAADYLHGQLDYDEERDGVATSAPSRSLVTASPSRIPVAA